MTTHTVPPSGLPRVLPHLVYDDVDAAVTWLADAFGFSERTQYRHSEPDGSTSRTQLDVVDSVITVGRPSVHGASPATGVSSMLYVYVDGVDAHYARARAAGARIVIELDDAPWGDRRYQATDPQGHHWTFATPIAS
jgi:PhnB protein